jgi:hypothetical protein
MNTEVQHAAMEDGPTVTDLEYKMVLDNIAMYEDFGYQGTDYDSYPLPWFLRFSTVSISATRGISTQFQYQWVQQLTSTLTNAIANAPTGTTGTLTTAAANQGTLQRQLQGAPSAGETRQWTFIPVTDGVQLVALRKVYLDGLFNVKGLNPGSSSAWLKYSPPSQGNALSGHYGKTTVWVTRHQMGSLNKLVIKALNAAPSKPSEILDAALTR